MNHIVYLKPNQTTELTHKDVVLEDAAQIHCDDQNVTSKCNSMKVMTTKADAKWRYIMSVPDVIDKLKQLNFTIDVNNVGEADFIIAYKSSPPSAYIWQWIKTTFVCLVCFFSAVFVVMTLNSDVSVTDVLSEVFKLVMGYESGGFTVLRVSYSIGLVVGIIGFFSHFVVIELNTGPILLEVEMRFYEGNTDKTLTTNGSRKESKTDTT